MEEYGEALLAEDFNFFRFAQHFRPCRNQNVLAVVRVHISRDQTVDRPCEGTVQSVDQEGLEDRALEDHESLPHVSAECAGRRHVWIGKSFRSWLIVLDL